MATPTAPDRWLDFSGAPPMLIPCSLVHHWRGGTDPATGEYRRFDPETPVTDYDRACAAAWPGRSILEVMGAQVLVLYTEFDWHTWDSRRQIVACGGWLPTDDDLQSATWSDAIHWRAEQTDYFLMNSAADAKEDYRTMISCRCGCHLVLTRLFTATLPRSMWVAFIASFGMTAPTTLSVDGPHWATTCIPQRRKRGLLSSVSALV